MLQNKTGVFGKDDLCLSFYTSGKARQRWAQQVIKLSLRGIYALSVLVV